METTFQKILEEKMGLEEAKRPSIPHGSAEPLQEFSFSIQDIIAPKTPRSFSGSLYIEYQKDPIVLEARRTQVRLQREKLAFCAFLNKLPSEKAKTAAENFYRYGARKFLSGTLNDLKKDFRSIAKQVHPDVHTLATEEKNLYFHREFRLMRESFEILSSAISLAK